MINGWNKGCTFQKRLRVNSQNRTNPLDSDTNFFIDLGQNVNLIKAISVTSVSFNNVFYNVFNTKTKYNNYFTMTVTGVGAGTYVLGVTPGYYSANVLASEINTVVNAALPGTTLTFNMDPITNYMSVYGTTTSTSIIFSAPSSAPPNSLGRQVYWPFGILGFDGPMTLSTSSSSPNLATRVPSLNEPSIAYISSSSICPSYSFDEKGSVSNILQPINLTVPYGTLQTFECKQDILCSLRYDSPRPLGRVDIQLVDHEGDILDLHGTPLNIEFLIWLNTY